MTAGVQCDAKPTDCGSWAPPTSPRAHLVGIAGSGMRALADVLLGRGWRIGGSDLTLDPVEQLVAAGVQLRGGHAAEHLPEQTDLVVYSDAVAADNPELQRAAELGIPALSYFEMIGRLTADSHTLAVAGTHGKSTTTAMAAAVLTDAGCDPTVFCGATPLGKFSGGRAGNDRVTVVEACEYRENFLHLRPRQAAILGIEPDHFDYFHSRGQLEAAFAQFAHLVPSDGLVLARHDCPVTRRVAADLPCRVATLGTLAAADWSVGCLVARRGRYTFEIRRRRQPVCEVNLQMPGRHNVLNALAAAAMAWEYGVQPGCIGDALSRFRGLHRRLQLRGNQGGAAVIDDYAHHPTEVTATLKTVRRMYAGRRVWCVFQPHQVSRTERLLDELAESLQNADRVLVAEIFRAREGAPKSGEVAAVDLARAVRRLGTNVPEVHSIGEIVRLLQEQLAPGDVLVTLGAGDIGRVADEFAHRFRKDRAAG